MENYNYIVNPETSRKVQSNGKIGRKILRNYISQLGGVKFSTKFLTQSSRTGCKKRRQEGNKNNIPFITFFCGAICRLSYEYPALFTTGLKFLFNLRIADRLSSPINFEELEERIPFKMIGGGISKLNSTISNRLSKTENYPENSAQYLAFIINRSFEYMAKNKKSFKSGAKNFEELYQSRPVDFKNNIGGSSGLSYIYLASGEDLNAYIIYDKINKKMFLVFRGTMSVKSGIVDAKIARTTITSGNRSTNNRNQYGQLHNGFMSQLRNVFHRIAYAMKKLTSLDKMLANNIELVVTGHSLGGATATIFAYFWASWKQNICEILNMGYLNNPFTLITWGSPRVGTTPFKKNMEEFINRGVIKHMRAKSDGDIVTEFPNKLSTIGGDIFKHIGIPLQCNTTLKLTSINYNKPLQCSIRKEGCSISKGALAHSNFAYINNMDVAKTLSTGHFGNKLKWEYYNLDNKIKNSTGTIINYREDNICCLESYENEFNVEWSITVSKTSPSFDKDGVRINTKDKFGVGMYGIKPKGFLNRMRKSRNITN